MEWGTRDGRVCANDGRECFASSELSHAVCASLGRCAPCASTTGLVGADGQGVRGGGAFTRSASRPCGGEEYLVQGTWRRSRSSGWCCASER